MCREFKTARYLREKHPRNDLSSYQLLSQYVKWCGFYFIVAQFYFSYFQPVFPPLKSFSKIHMHICFDYAVRLQLRFIKHEVTYFECYHVNVICRNLVMLKGALEEEVSPEVWAKTASEPTCKAKN